MDFVVGLPMAQTRHGDAIADRLSKFASYEPVPASRVFHLQTDGQSLSKSVGCVCPRADPRRPGDVADDVAKAEAIPEVSATWSKMLAQEMHSATRSNKMPSPTRSIVWGSRYRMESRCDLPAERSKHGVDKIAVASPDMPDSCAYLLDIADVKIEFVVIRSVLSKNVDAAGDLGGEMA